jgi:oligoendopeptidase F
LLGFIELDIELSRKIDKVYLYSHMKNDEDLKNDKYKSFYDKAVNLYTKYNELTSWFVPELLKIEDNKIIEYLSSEALKPYKFHIEKLIRQKAHVLNENEEKLLSMAQNVFMTSSDTFRSLNDCDLKFGKIIDAENNELTLTHAQYYLYLINKDRNIRKKAFSQYHNKYDEFATTMASLLYGKVKEHVFYARARNYKNSLEASLYKNNIDTSVYKNLIKTVRDNISALHDFMKYRKKLMGLKGLHLYDVYVPFIEMPEIEMEYSEAKELIFKSLKPLGDEYIDILKKGIEKERWADKYENENKRSGAYSTGCYDSYPFMLLNFNGTLNAVRTLIHEAGHSMHSYFSNKTQAPIYANYPIFLAEVASTFNEELLNNYLIKNSNDDKMTAYLINSRLDEIRTTLFRQTMFAEFELMIHEKVENNIPLTYKLLKDEYRKLNEFYFGKDVVIDEEIDIEWARIPHFYYNFYVYQYATGISAAIYLYKKVAEGSEKNRNDYFNFLRAGCSKYPLDILKDAGVDMTSNEPVKQAIFYFKELLDKLELSNK